MTSPTIAGVQFSSTSLNADGWIKKAAIVTARVTFSEGVFVTGKPLLNLMVGSTPVQAKYFSGSSTTRASSSELLFTFTVAANMFDADGLSLASTSLSLPTGAAIKNSLAEMAELSVLNPLPVAGLKVDSTLAVVGINGADATRFGTTIKKGVAQSLDFSVSEAGTVYLLSTKLPFTGVANALATQKKSISIASAQASNLLSLEGLAPDIYKLYFVDAAGNLTTLTKTITVDNVAPKLLAAPTISGATGLEKSTLNAGDVVTFSAKFSEEVVVSGGPKLAFKAGTETLYANFSSVTTVSGKSTVFFTHTVDYGVRDANGISIGANAIALNGGSISDYAGNTATLTHALVKDNAGYKVDSVANQLVSIGIDAWTPGTQVLKDAGQTITFKAVFGEQVSVLGTPKLNVNVGGTVLQATAVASTVASTEVKFVLTLPLNVADSDGISLGVNPIEMTSANKIYSPVSTSMATVTFAGAQFATYKVDAMAASISEVVFTNSRTDSPAMLKLGDVVTATVKFSEAVVVSNKSALMLKLGELDAKATYLSGSNSDTIKFTYTVTEGMQTSVGIKLAEAPLIGMTGTSAVKDMAGFNANLGFNFAGVVAYLPVDAKSAVISSINISSPDAVNGCVGIGARITAVVNFSEAVEVTGNPTLKLKLDAATPVVATYTGGDNTNALTFVYTVSAGDTAISGVGTPSAPLTLNGAVLKDAAGNLLKTAFAATVSSTKVDTTGPVASLVTYKGDTGGSLKTLKAGDVIAFELTYPEAVTVTGVPSIGVQIGANTRQALCTGQNVSRTVLKFSYTVQAGDTDTDGIALGAGLLTLTSGSITDAYGNPASLSHPAASFVVPLKVDTTAPDAPVLSIAEGAQNGVTYSEIVAGTPVYQVSSTGASKLEVTLTNAQDVTVTVLHTNNLGAQSYQLTRQDMLTLGAGQINVSATALDASGNRSQVATGSFNIDLAQVSVTQVALVGGKASGFYKVGDIVVANLTFSETVVLQTTALTKPTVTFVVGETEVQATYVGGSNSSTLRFAYTVGADHADDDGVGLLQNSLQLNGSTLVSLSGVAPVLAHASVLNNSELKIDNVAPDVLTVQLAQDMGSSDVDLVTNKRAVTVGGQETDGTWQYSTNAGTTWFEGTGTSFLLAVKSHAADAIRVRQTDRAGNVGEATVLAGPVVIDTSGGNISTIVFSEATGAQNAFLNAGDVLTAMVSFSELVDVTGQPKLALMVGSTAVQASYATGSGTSALYFTYTVAADMTDADGIHVPLNALSLNGAALKDRAGNVMQITSVLGSADTNYRVDTTKPAVLVLDVTVTGQFSESQAFTLNPQAGISGLESNATWQFSTDAGASWSNGSAQAFVIPDGLYEAGAILIRQLDAAGNASDATAFPRALVVDTGAAAPTLTLSTDAGVLGTDGVSNVGSVAVGALEAGAAWQYSTNNGATWTAGTGSSFTLAAGSYAADAIQVKQTDLVGNVSAAGKNAGSIVIDQTAATVSSVAITSATGVQNSRLNVGDVVTATVAFSEIVHVSDTPQLGLNIGGSTVQANYAGGTGTANLTFTYTIAAAQTDANGISIAANALGLNTTGTIKDTAGNNATLTHALVADNAAYMVDTTAATVSSIAITSATGAQSSLLNAGDVVTFTATFSEAVNVTGSPLLGITVGATPVNATYAAGSGTTALTFVYTILAGQTDADGININVNAINLNAGTINDLAGNVSTLTSVVGTANAAYMVDTTAATVNSVAITSATGVQNSRLNVGDVVTATVAFSEIVHVSDTPQLGLNIGGSTVQANYAGGTGTANLTFTYTIAAAQTDANGISIAATALDLNTTGTIKDTAGNNATLTHALVADNAAYMVDTTAPATLTLTMASDTGNSSTDNISNSGVMNIGSLEAGATWQHSINGGSTWTTGTGTNFTLAAGSYTANAVQVRQTDLAGNTGAATLFSSAIVIDQTAATVSGVVITSATGAQSSFLNVGDVVTATVAFSEIVHVSNTPQLGLNIGGSTVQANYAGGTGTANLTFTYTIQAGQTDADGISIALNSLGLNSGTIKDTAGNNASLTHALVAENAAYKVDTTTPVFTSVATASVTENVSTQTSVYVAQATDGGSASTYSLSGADAAQFNINASTGAVSFKSTPNRESPTDTGANNVYDITVVATDLAGNTASRAVAITVTDIVNELGKASFSLGSGYGNLITPLQVEGKWYYLWDRSGSGSFADNYNDWTVHDVLDGIFRYASDFTTLDTDNNTDNTYRFALINGAKVALPTYGGAVDANGKATLGAWPAGTAVSDTTQINATYDDLLAIWDALNGSTTGTNIGGVPSGWLGYAYHSATPGASGHISVDFTNGLLRDESESASNRYVALQLLEAPQNWLKQTTDTGSSASDNISSNGLVTVPDLVTGNTWQYTTNGGSSWTTGTGSTFTLGAGAYAINAVQVRQTTPEGVTTTTATNIVSLVVDTGASVISAVELLGATGAQNGSLNTGDVVTAAVTFDEAVIVTGVPKLSLMIDASAVSASYVSGSGSSTLLFTYTIQAEQTDANGISIAANALSLNSGTIKDVAGNAATLTHALVADNAAYMVDTTAATMNSVAITSATGAQNSLLNAGDVVTFTATFSEAVNVTGSPLLGITVGATPVNATYAAGSGTTALTFVYTILAGQTDADGININVNAINLNAGTINDLAGNVSTLTSVVGTANAAYMVDTTAATVNSVAITSATGVQNSRLNVGDVVTATVAFSEIVHVSDTPQLGLNIGGSTVQANYAGGTGTANLTFTYTIAAAQTDANGISIAATALDLNTTGTIKDTAGNNATLTHALVADNAAYMVDTTAATVSSIAITSATGVQSSLLNAGDVVTFTATFSEAVNVTGSPLLGITLGATPVNATYAAGSGTTTLTFVYTILAGQTDADGINVNVNGINLNAGTINDPAGNVSTLTSVVGTANAAYMVDTTAATVNSVSITSATGVQSSTLSAGDVVTATVAFSEIVHVSNTPQLGLNIGGSTVQANYAGGTGTANLTFTYTIAAAQTDANGISIAANSLGLNTTGTIKDTAGNNATLTHALVADNAAYMVDTSAPVLSITTQLAGRSVIDLGADGKLIAPVQIDGGKWFYYWDRSGDGTSANTGSLNGGTDAVTHDVLDGIFKYASDFTTLNPGVDTTTVYRYATVNGVKLALPTQGYYVNYSNYSGYSSVDNNPVGEANALFDDLMAIWDAHNGGGTNGFGVNGGSGIPTSWNGVWQARYWSANSNGAGSHMWANFSNGYNGSDPDSVLYTAALEVVTALTSAATISLQSSELGTVYIVNKGVTVTNLASITAAADAQWNSVAIATANTDTNLALTGLADGNYALYAADAAGNLSAVSSEVILIDGTAPTVISTAISSATGILGDTLSIGDVLTATVSFSETVYATEIPRLALDIGGTTVYATYFAGSGSNTLSFQYAILAGQTDADGISIAANSLGLNGGLLQDAARYNASLTHAAVAANTAFKVEAVAPTATVTAATIDNTKNVVVQSSELGTAYLVKNTVSASSVASITTAADNLWNSVSITSINTATNLSAAGLIDGTYKVYTVDAAGNLSAASSGSVTVDSTAPVAALLVGGESVIDMGTYGKLIAPVMVDGGHWFYYWDRSGDGTSADAGTLNGGVDTVNHDVLDALFNYARDFTTVNPGTETTDIYRYATINGMKLALPLLGYKVPYVDWSALTAIDNSPVGETNVLYDDLAALWDAHNGSAVAAFGTTAIAGVPSGWYSGTGPTYHAADYSAASFYDLNFGNGRTATELDTVLQRSALELISAMKTTETVAVRSSEVGNAYLVNTSLAVTNLASITDAADTLWNTVALASANTNVNMSLTGLSDGNYKLYTTDAAGNLSAASTGTLKVDAAVPTLSSVAITAASGAQNYTLNVGDVVTVTATFSESVVVVGLPQLALTIGGATVQATYDRGSGGTAIDFTYTIAAGQTDANGISITANVMTLNSGSIQDFAGNNATLTHAAVGDNIAYQVDTTAATVSTVAIVGASGLQGSLLNIGDVVTAAVTFSEKVLITGTPQLGLNVGGTVVQSNYFSGKGSNTLLFTYTVASGLTDANGISINANALALNAGTITDVSGNNTVITHAAVLDNAAYAVEDTAAPAAPTLALGSGYTYAVDATSGAGLSNLVSVTGTTGLTISVKFTSSTGGTVTKTLTATGAAQTVSLTNAELLTLKDGVISASAWTTNASGKNSLTTTLGNGLAAELPASLSLGTVSGVNLNLVSKLTLGSGKVYYILDQNGDGFYDNSDRTLVHDSLDTLLNAGANTIDTQLRGAVAGIDDERTIVQGGYTLVLPTANEWTKFNDPVLGTSFPVSGWTSDMYFTSSLINASNHNPAFVYPTYVHISGGYSEDHAYRNITAFEVLSNGSFKLDVTPRSFTSAASVSVAENTATSTVVYTPVVSDEGSLYYEISGSDASLFTINSTTGAVVFKGRPDFENRLDANQDGVYNINIVTTDSVGTVLTSPVSITVTDVAETATTYTVGQAVIDLGGYGKLIAPVTVEGKTYYYWDRSGDGVASNGAGTENQTFDYTDHQTLDRIFKFASDFTTTNPAGFGADTTNTYRYATLNGVKLALPTYGGPVDANGNSADGGIYRAGTAVADGTTVNSTYDDLLAIWDAFNGSATSGNNAGLPSGWLSGNVMYHSATKASADVHQGIYLWTGVTGQIGDTGGTYVALQVLA